MDSDGLPEGFWGRYEQILARELDVPGNRRPFFRKWFEEFLEFCRIRNLERESKAGLDLFLEGLRKRGRKGFQVDQARASVEAYWKHFSTEGSENAAKKPSPLISQPGDWAAALSTLGNEIRLRHFSGKTFKAYRHWVRGFAKFMGAMPVPALTSRHARAYLQHLAVDRKVAGSTQNQAFSALLFFYTNVLKTDLQGLETTPRAARRQDIPSVLTREEVRSVLAGLENPYRLFAQLLYGCGLRLNEALTLRVQDLDLESGGLRVHNGKGNKSRALPMPKAVLPGLREHLQSVKNLFAGDLSVGFAGAFLPEALERKYPGASRSWPWQWVFPGGKLSVSESDGKLRRFHLHESSVQKEIKAAADAVSLDKRVTAHTFRPSYATHLLQMGYDIRIVQDLLGHRDLETTMIYTHVVQSLAGKVISPLDV